MLHRALFDKDGWCFLTIVKSPEEFIERFGEIIKAVKDIKISGFCYTQITDVGQEYNGLLTAERKPKVPIEEILKFIK